MKPNRILAAALGLLAGAAVAVAAFVPVTPAQAQILSGQAGPNFKNLIDNGNFNIYQRGTALVGSITTAALYHADRWAAYSGTATTATLSNATLGLPAAPAPTFTNAEQLQRNGGAAGILPTCLVQEIPTSDITPLAGQPVTLSFWALAGANFSAANSVLNPILTTGTGTDEGLATLITGFTGAATPISASQVITTGWQRYAWTGTIATTATEAAVQFCYTPVGTAGTNDYFRVTGVQLEQGTVATNFEWRPAGIELAKVQRYFYQITESKTALNSRAICAMSTTSIANCLVQFPVTMRVAPTMTLTAGFEVSAAVASTTATVCTALTLSATLTGSAASTQNALLDCASSAGFGAAGTAGFMWDIGTSSGTGIIKASADF
jgi:hypothetical protein